MLLSEALMKKVRGIIICDDAINSGIHISSKQKKRDLGDTYAIFILDAYDNFFILEIRFFKHNIGTAVYYYAGGDYGDLFCHLYTVFMRQEIRSI